jgi:LEA14-like dessication related protein
MKRLLSLLLIAALVAGTAVGAQYYAFQKIDIRFQDAQVSGLSTSGVEMTFVTEAENPTPIGIIVSEQYLELYANGNHVATVDRRETLLVPGGGSRLLKYPTTLDAGGAIEALVEHLSTEQTTIRVQGQYTFTSRWLGVEFGIPVEERVHASR